MRCPYCSFESTRVLDSRLSEPDGSVRRRRRCAGCGTRFTTYERPAEPALSVVKRDGRRERFDRAKLLGGLQRATAKRPVEAEQLEGVVESIVAEAARASGPVEAARLGELALRALAALDRVAAIRFASVYRQFDDPAEFEEELRRLERAPAMAGSGAAPAANSDASAAGPSGRGASMGISPRGRAGAGGGEPNSRRRRHAARR